MYPQSYNKAALKLEFLQKWQSSLNKQKDKLKQDDYIGLVETQDSNGRKVKSLTKCKQSDDAVEKLCKFMKDQFPKVDQVELKARNCKLTEVSNYFDKCITVLKETINPSDTSSGAVASKPQPFLEEKQSDIHGSEDLTKEYLRLSQEVKTLKENNEDYRKQAVKYTKELQAELQELEETKKKRTDEINHLREKCDNLQQQFENMQKLQKKKSIAHPSDSGHEDKKSDEIRILENQLQSIQKNINDSENKIDNLVHTLTERNKQIDSIEKEIEKVNDGAQNELDKIRQQGKLKQDNIQKDLDQLIKRREELNKKAVSIDKSEPSRNESLLTSELKDKSDELKNIKDQNSKLKADFEKQKFDIELLQFNNDTLIKVLKNKKQELEKVCSGKIKNKSQVTNQLKDLLTSNKENFDREKSFLSSLKEQLKESETEKQYALTKLSKIAGDRLTDNNPDIADLSDNNRPTKLMEELSELYDNQWTDAFESLNKNMDEPKALALLKNVIVECKQLTGGVVLKKRKEFAKLYGVDDFNQLPRTTAKLVKDMMKVDLLEDTLPSVVETLLPKLKEKYPALFDNNESGKEYCQAALNITYKMNVQVPPVVFKKLEPGTKFDTNSYKQYTVTGPVVEYEVWPAVLLHENGPLLNKGVAQGLKQDKK